MTLDGYSLSTFNFSLLSFDDPIYIFASFNEFPVNGSEEHREDFESSGRC